jgi:hypothetical protein
MSVPAATERNRLSGIWERQPDESIKAYDAFRRYSELGRERSLVGVAAALAAQKMERNHLHPTLVQTRSETLFQIDVERNTAGPSVGDVGPAAE